MDLIHKGAQFILDSERTLGKMIKTKIKFGIALALIFSAISKLQEFQDLVQLSIGVRNQDRFEEGDCPLKIVQMKV